MVKVTLQNLGTIVREKRGTRGLREVSAEVGTSAPTLSRIESGKMPDLQTFGKLCRWLGADPASLLGVSNELSEPSATRYRRGSPKGKEGDRPSDCKCLGACHHPGPADSRGPARG